MTPEAVQHIAEVAHTAACSVLDEAQTSVVPLIIDSRYAHKWVPLDVDHDGQANLEAVKAAAMHLAQMLIHEGVREFMPLQIPKGCEAFRADDNRLSVRAAYLYVIDPRDGTEPGPRLRIDMAGLKPVTSAQGDGAGE